MSDRSKLTRAEQVRAEAFALAVPTVAGRGNRTFLDLFARAEEIEACSTAPRSRESSQPVPGT